MKVRFVRDYKVKDTEGKEYKKGKVYDLSDARVRHFLNRNAVEVVGAEAVDAGPERTDVAAGETTARPKARVRRLG